MFNYFFQRVSGSSDRTNTLHTTCKKKISLKDLSGIELETGGKGQEVTLTNDSGVVETFRRIRLGILCMAIKQESAPMAEILKRLEDYQSFDIILFKEDMIFNEPIEDWPIVDCLIGFHSKGFPSEKALEYVNLRNPIEINPLRYQKILRSRVSVYETLKSCGVPCPDYFVIDHSRCRYTSPSSNVENTETKTDEKKDSPTASPPPLLEATIPLSPPSSPPCLKPQDEACLPLNPNPLNWNTVGELIRPAEASILSDAPSQMDGRDDWDLLEEHDNFIKFNGRILAKPFVEKPIDSFDHAVWIHYPMNAGGGVKKLFRKVGCKASEYCASIKKVRKDNRYIYEPFHPTQGTDIKVYTVGEGYFHAEARKAPTVDGKVLRGKTGKEIRYPIILAENEKIYAALIVQGFRQTLCGFDILRTKNESIICDVNGWSFVKGNQKYYDDCALLIGRFFLSKFFSVPRALTFKNAQGEKERFTAEDLCFEGKHEEGQLSQLRTSILPTTFLPFVPGTLITAPLDKFTEWQASKPTGRYTPISDTSVKIRQPSEYWEEYQSNIVETDMNPLENERLRCVSVVMRHGDRKPKDKLKFYTFHPNMLEFFVTQQDVPAVPDKALFGCPANNVGNARFFNKATQEVLIKAPDEMKKLLEVVRNISLDPNLSEDQTTHYGVLKAVLEMHDRFSGLNRKVQLKGKALENGWPTKILVIAKWGGELTKPGYDQAERLGRKLRLFLYPTDQNKLLRLHATFQHDFKIFSSLEGRCQMTAAAFTKGFLDLEGDLTPILISLVTRDRPDLLDEPIPKDDRDFVKQQIDKLLHVNEVKEDSMGPLRSKVFAAAVKQLENPQALMHHVVDLALKYIGVICRFEREISQSFLVSSDQECSPSSPKRPQLIVSERNRLNSNALDVSGSECLTPIRRRSSQEGDSSLGEKELSSHEGEQKQAFSPRGAASGHLTSLDELRLNKTPIALHRLNVIDQRNKRLWLVILRLIHRWRKLINGFSPKVDGPNPTQFDTSKIPDLWDNIYYDLYHRREDLPSEAVMTLEALYNLVHPLNLWTSRAEYGIESQEKLTIGVGVVRNLLAKVLSDLEFSLDKFDDAGKQVVEPIMSITPPERDRVKESQWVPRLHASVSSGSREQTVRSRIYVTSASSMNALFNVLVNQDVLTNRRIINEEVEDSIIEFGYMSHIVFRCFERVDRRTLSPKGRECTLPSTKNLENRFRVEVLISPGIQVLKNGEMVPIPGGHEVKSKAMGVAPMKLLLHNLSIEELDTIFSTLLGSKGHFNPSCESGENE